MKKIVFAGLALCVFISCKKEVTNDPGNPAKTDLSITNVSFRQPTDCNFTPVTQTGTNEWQAYFGSGSLVKFSDLHMSGDGQLHGRLISAGTNYTSSGYMLISGYEDYNRRDFSFQQNSCAITRNETILNYAQYLNNTNGSTVFSAANGNPYSGSTIVTSTTGGWMAHMMDWVNNNVIYKTVEYQWSAGWGCTSNIITAGKFVRKITHLSNGNHTLEYGIAPLCYTESASCPHCIPCTNCEL